MALFRRAEDEQRRALVLFSGTLSERKECLSENGTFGVKRMLKHKAKHFLDEALKELLFLLLLGSWWEREVWLEIMKTQWEISYWKCQFLDEFLHTSKILKNCPGCCKQKQLEIISTGSLLSKINAFLPGCRKFF